MFWEIFNLNCIGWSSKHINDFSIHLIRSFILKLAYKNPKHMAQPLIVCYLFACSIEILSKEFHGTIGRMRFLNYAWAANNDCLRHFSPNNHLSFYTRFTNTIFFAVYSHIRHAIYLYRTLFSSTKRFTEIKWIKGYSTCLK